MACAVCGKREYESGFCKEHFMRYFEKKVRSTIKRFELFKKDAKIAVAASGGKDSTVLLYLLHKFGYDVTGITINTFIGSYTEENLKNLRSVCEEYAIPLKEISVRDEFGHSICHIKALLAEKGAEMQSCAICGVLRRYLLNKHAKGFDAIATGHNMDDEAQAFIMNIFRNDTKQVYRQGPAGKSKAFVKRVKPLYLCKEAETRAYSKAMGFPVNYGRCPCATDAYRMKFREFLDAFEREHPNVKDNILNFYLTEYWPRTAEGELTKCARCGQPSSTGICKACELLSAIRGQNAY